ncbi:hypothetical protein KORDIASMS9_04580 [Kordia sp. SMS9]|uniref:hypothetical protein n=1 Tax=Kordia sp. SMS9 TaxID=2282170 RepID=UPI000E0CEFFC|nr:hypothetical protein [Kordia sp. SMS9]AXG72309.1 hypothetical protein KORDIASMS9_04580 [Kordia sp. SMS9]
MIAKKCFSALLILTILFGFYKEQTPAPNQEIELQFSDNVAVTQDATLIIQAIKQQLENVGVENIQVRERTAQTLKIAYFSEDAVATIKEFLVEKGLLANDELPTIPAEEQQVYLKAYANVDQYKIDIYELQSTSDSYFGGAHGKYILDLHKEFDKSPTPNSFAKASSFIEGDYHILAIEFTYTISGDTVIHKEHIAYEIPDVRAGPSATSLI